LIECGVDMLTLANNHALDEYFDGLKATIDNCEKKGLDFVGGARTQEEHDAPVIKEIAEISVGFLNYTYGTNSMERFCNKNATKYGVNYSKGADFKRDAKALRDAGAEVIVAYMHWGEEFNRKANTFQKTTAKKLAEAGVDVIVGGHPHVVQSPIEWVKAKREDGTTKQTLCVYSIGNFLSDQPKRYRDAGIVFDFTIQEIREGKFEIQSPKYIPTFYWRRGNEKKGYTIRVVACGEWLEERPEGMNDESYTRLKQIWGETSSLLGENIAEISIN
jgi:poly-gamma-glutamate synthesis protein (capsule biosynthesis protein)